jgi:hypothetical protein
MDTREVAAEMQESVPPPHDGLRNKLLETVDEHGMALMLEEIKVTGQLADR